MNYNSNTPRVRILSDPEIRKMKYSSNDSEDTLTISTERKVLLGLPILKYYQADDNIYAGEYPLAEDEENGLVILEQLTVLGITFIVDLTEDNELNQYKHNLSSIVHVRFPIKDRQIPGSFEITKNLCDQIRKALDNNNIIYINIIFPCQGIPPRIRLTFFYTFFIFFLIYIIFFV